MNGRQENQLLLDKQVELMTKKSPKIVKRYTKWFSEDCGTTKVTYVSRIINYFDFLKSEGYDINNPEIFKDFTGTDIKIYLKSLNKIENGEVIEASSSVKNIVFYALKNFFNFLIDERIITYNPCSNVKLVQKNQVKPIVYMTPEEIDIMRQNIVSNISRNNNVFKNRDLAIVTLGVRTGLRIEAIREIDIDQIDFKNKCINVIEKGHKHRTVYIGDNTIEVLKNWIEDRNKLMYGYTKHNALFISNRRVRISKTGLYKIIVDNAKGIDKHITPHKMRSSCATNLLAKNNDVYLVQQILGHANIATTQRYAAVSNEKINKAVELMDDI